MWLIRLLLATVVVLTNQGECEYLRATTSNYNIGFENVNNRVRNTSSNQRYEIGFENVHNRLNNTSHQKPVTTPSYHSSKPRNSTTTRKPNVTSRSNPPRNVTIKPNKVYVTSSPKRPYVTTIKPSISKVTTRPISSSKKPLPLLTTRKPLKPKFTTTTTPKPTRPTLPPSIYVKPNISKVIIPPVSSNQWISAPSPGQWQPNVVTTSPMWNNTNGMQPTLPPLPQPEHYKDVDFKLFLMHLHDFTRKAEHNRQIKYKRYNGDAFNYYYEIYNYYNNGHLAAKQYRVPVDSLKNCQTNSSKVMCLSNTNAICLKNGTMMCVTHLSATIPCEENTASCAITYVPCDGRYQSCVGKSEPLFVGIPCISKVTLVPSTNDFYQQLTISPIDYCVTSVITPKRLYSPVGSFMSMLLQTGKHHYDVIKNSTIGFANFLLK